MSGSAGQAPESPGAAGDEPPSREKPSAWWVSKAAWIAVALGIAIVLIVDLHGTGTADQNLRRPNVLLLVMDTTRADRCSFEGYDRPTTPRLAEFAKDAVVFRDAWSPGGWTGPAHASLFTGLRPEHHGFHDGDRNFLAAGPRTLAETLSAAGYSTGCFSNNSWIAPEFGLTRGFGRIEQLNKRTGRPYPWARETHNLAEDWAVAEARAGRPFFLFINDMEPHLPYSPPPEDQARFLRGDPTPEEIAEARNFDLQDATAFGLDATEIAPRVLGAMSDLYDAEIAVLDREIGALLDHLRADGLLDSTIVVIAGDHGELLGEHHMVEHGHSLHRAARHVPLLVRYPGHFDAGRAVESVVRLEDVPVTLLELCGLPAPADVDGVSLTHDLAGRVSIAIQGAFPGRRAWIEKTNPGVDPSRFLLGLEAVYDGRFHCLTYSDGRRELFDDRADPGETDDLAAREPNELARMLALLHPSR